MISTYVLILVSILILFLLNSLDTKTITQTVRTPSLIDYTKLQQLYPNTLKCSCSKTIIPYQTFVSFFPILHQICTSDLINNEWLFILQMLATDNSYDNNLLSRLNSILIN